MKGNIMPFVKYIPEIRGNSGRAIATVPIVRWAPKSGTFTLNSLAIRALGFPEYIEFLHDPATKEFAIRGSTEEDGGLRLRKGDKHQTLPPNQLSSKGFARTAGFCEETNSSITVIVEGGMLIGKIPVTVPRTNNNPRFGENGHVSKATARSRTEP
jgi:hypothetical protein